MNTIDMNDAPLTNRDNGIGRDQRGRFASGNPGGPGNPMAAQVAQLRRAAIEAVEPVDMRAVTRKLVELAKKGNVPAIREFYNRTLGNPIEVDLLERIERFERFVAKFTNAYGQEVEIEATTGGRITVHELPMHHEMTDLTIEDRQ